MNTKEFLEYLQVFLDAKEFELSKRFFYTFAPTLEANDALLTLDIIYKIYAMEKEFQEPHFIEQTTNISLLLEKYEIIKFYLRRYDFDIKTDDNEFLEFISQNNINISTLLWIIRTSIVNNISVTNKLAVLYGQRYELDKAERLLSVAYENSKDDITLFNYSFILWKKQNFQMAKVVIEQISSVDKTIISLKNLIDRKAKD